MGTATRLAAALAAASTILAAGCGDTNVDAQPATGDAASAEVVATTLEVVATDHHFDLSADTVAEGAVPIELDNQGQSPHQILVVRLDDGQTMDDYLAAFESGEGTANQLVTQAGGVNVVDPGASGIGYADLAPGTYLVLCYIPGEGGLAHLQHGMIEELTVVPDDTVPAPDAPVGDIELADFSFGLPAGGLSTSGTYRVTNEGSADHEMALMRIDDDKAFGDVVAYLQSGFQGEPPVAFTGGAGGIEPGAEGYVDLDLAPGEYVAMCFLEDEATGKRHAELGMVLPFTVG